MEKLPPNVAGGADAAPRYLDVPPVVEWVAQTLKYLVDPRKEDNPARFRGCLRAMTDGSRLIRVLGGSNDVQTAPMGPGDLERLIAEASRFWRSDYEYSGYSDECPLSSADARMIDFFEVARSIMRKWEHPHNRYRMWDRIYPERYIRIGESFEDSPYTTAYKGQDILERPGHWVGLLWDADSVDAYVHRQYELETTFLRSEVLAGLIMICQQIVDFDDDSWCFRKKDEEELAGLKCATVVTATKSGVRILQLACDPHSSEFVTIVFRMISPDGGPRCYTQETASNILRWILCPPNPESPTSMKEAEKGREKEGREDEPPGNTVTRYAEGKKSAGFALRLASNGSATSGTQSPSSSSSSLLSSNIDL